MVRLREVLRGWVPFWAIVIEAFVWWYRRRNVSHGWGRAEKGESCDRVVAYDATRCPREVS